MRHTASQKSTNITNMIETSVVDHNG